MFSLSIKSNSLALLILTIAISVSSCKNSSDIAVIQSKRTSQIEIGEFKDADKLDSTFFSIQSSPSFFPTDAEPILLSFYFKYLEQPPIDKRQRLITNYDSQNVPYAGWALSMTRLRTSLRLEFYLKDKEGVGGWYTLSPLDISKSSKDDWYAMTFLILPGNFISSLYAKVNPDFTPKKDDKSYITGVSIDSLAEIEADAIFQITSGAPKSSSLRVEIKELVLFKLNNIPNDSDFLTTAKGGPRKLKESYRDSCVLALDGDGQEFCEIYAKRE